MEDCLDRTDDGPTDGRRPMGDTAGHTRTDWLGLFRDLQHQLESATSTDDHSHPDDLAITVVAEALAVAITLDDTYGRAATAPSRQPAVGHSSAATHSEATGVQQITAAYTGVDCGPLDRRTRHLRTALNSVDDLIWWGRLNASST